jgi:hypothetical protein
LKHPTPRPTVSLFTTIPAGLNVAYWIPLQRESPSVLNKSGTHLTYFLTFFKQWMASPKKFYFGFGIRIRSLVDDDHRHRPDCCHKLVAVIQVSSHKNLLLDVV